MRKKPNSTVRLLLELNKAGLLGSTALHWAVSSEQGDPDYAADDDKVEGEGASTRGR